MEHRTSPKPVARMPRNRRTTRNPEPKPSCDEHEHTEAIPRTEMSTVLDYHQVDSSVRTRDYVSPQAYAGLVTKLLEKETENAQLAEQNRRNMHQIHTLQGSNTGFEAGTEHLHSRINELQEQLARCEVQMTQCIEERDKWKESYEAEVKLKSEEAQVCNQLKAENRSLRNDTGHWARLFQISGWREESETEIVFRLQHRCRGLEHANQSLARQIDQREFSYQEHLKKVNGRIDELTAQCSNLAKQSGLRRTYVPIEDEAEVIDAFRQLHVAVRYFCHSAWDLKPQDAEVRFEKFPLARKDDVQFSTDDFWLLVACVWECLMKGIFDVSSRTGNKGGDLFLDETTGSALTYLGKRIGKVQKADIIHEWRSFTVQCLYDEKWAEDSSRLDNLAVNIMYYILGILNRDDAESEAVQRLMAELKTEVLTPAINFAAILRKRYTPIVIQTPMTVDSAIRIWYKTQLGPGRRNGDLEIVVKPALRKLDLGAVVGDCPFLEFVDAEWYTLIEKQTSVKDKSEEVEELEGEHEIV